MRMTIRLNDSLLAEVKKLAADTGRTLTGVLEDALREALARRQRPQPRTRVEARDFQGKGPAGRRGLGRFSFASRRMEGRDAVSFPVMRGTDCPPHA